jgi:ligand-binding SRPBCC domain-containing protein
MRQGGGYVLRTSQIFAIAMQDAFTFFEDPRNLFAITPDWLDFKMDSPETGDRVFEGGEYEYHIRWFGIKIPWKSRISRYNPPYDFTDIQVRGPYLYWEHTHSFEASDGNTLMRDTVKYALPFSVIGRIAHELIIRRQLKDIFSYRAMMINRWVEERES